ncbi:hypothetical protein JAO29_05110 [Edaphobacter sp. HDX4]|uniref:hypothetical protein n=1 Tax=Edaphobacter sp. HDX4 TaxID=2794064 RepID=UPI002FE57B85
MTPLFAFRTSNSSDPKGALPEIRPVAACAGAKTVLSTPATSSRAADYAYRIATLTAGLVLLATVM